MLIKEEPVSPGVRGAGAGGSVGGGEAVALSSSCEVCSSEPPVLPVAMVQSVLEGRGSVASMVERRSKRPALDRWALTHGSQLPKYGQSAAIYVWAYMSLHHKFISVCLQCVYIISKLINFTLKTDD